MTLEAGTAEMTREGGRELTVYFVVDESLTLNNNETHLKIVFKRRLTNEAVMTFFPSLLLIGISYFTSFFKLVNSFPLLMRNLTNSGN